MDVSWSVKYLTEFIATALLIMIGNGAVANVELKGTKGHKTGWLLISLGYGLGVMLPALMFGNVSGNHINPAFTLGLAVSNLFPWAHVFPYILAQLLGATFGQMVVVLVHMPYYKQTTEANNILGTFSTISAVDNGSLESRKPSWINGFLNEFFGSFILFFGALSLTKNYFGAELVPNAVKEAIAQGVTPTAEQIEQMESQVVQYVNGSQAVAHLGLGFLVMALVAAFGSATGPALNPARDLAPRFLHWLLPTSVLGQAKGDSKWWYAWVPVLAPILAAIAAVALYQAMYA